MNINSKILSEMEARSCRAWEKLTPDELVQVEHDHDLLLESTRKHLRDVPLATPDSVRMTQQQLKHRIWELQDIKCYFWVVGKGTPRTFWGYRQGEKGKAFFWACNSEEEARNKADGECPDPTTDYSYALPFLEELNNQQPYDAGHYPEIVGCGTHGWRLDLYFQPESDAPALEFSVFGKTLCLAICLAWVRYKSGENIELIEEEK